MSASYLGPALVITGRVEASDELSIAGAVEGEIAAKGAVTIEPGGVVRGPVHGRAVDVSGEVHGPIVASDRIELLTGAGVFGDLRAARIQIADGARFEGTVHMDRRGGAR